MGTFIKIVRGKDISELYFVQFNKKEGYLRLKNRFVDVICNLHSDLKKDKNFNSNKIRLWIKEEENEEEDKMFEEAKLWHDSAEKEVTSK
jgi:hypothetical protein